MTVNRTALVLGFFVSVVIALTVIRVGAPVVTREAIQLAGVLPADVPGWYLVSQGIVGQRGIGV